MIRNDNLPRNLSSNIATDFRKISYAKNKKKTQSKNKKINNQKLTVHLDC